MSNSSMKNRERIEMINRGPTLRPKPFRDISEYLGEIVNSVSNSKPKLVMFTAPSGMGSSPILNQVIREHSPTVNPKHGTREVPVVKIHLPPAFSIDDFYVEIIDALELPRTRQVGFGSPVSFVGYVLKKAETRMLIVEDFTSILIMTKSERNSILRILKNIGSKYNITVVVSGTHRIWSAISSDEQLKARAQKINLPEYSANDPNFIELLQSFCEWCPVQKKSTIAEDRTFRSGLISKTKGLHSKIIDELRQLAVYAILSRHERLTYEVWLEYHAK